MNITIFEKTQQKSQGEAHEQSHDDFSSPHNDVASIKQKIEKRKSKQKRLKIIFATLVGLVVVLASLFVYSQYKLYVLSKEEVSLGGNSTKNGVTVPKTPEEIVLALKRHILVPEGTPQIAEVQDVEKLKETQAFFKDTQNGDIVIVYETMIYVYRPSVDIVVAASDISGMGQTNP